MSILGKLGKDRVTGFTGIITGRAEYLYGCMQYSLTPAADGNKILSNEWFDEGRIEIVGAGISPSDVKAEVPGGPNRDAPRR